MGLAHLEQRFTAGYNGCIVAAAAKGECTLGISPILEKLVRHLGPESKYHFHFRFPMQVELLK